MPTALCKAANASKASTAAMRSPYAAGTAKAAGNSGATTPFTRKASPTNRKLCKRRRGRKASTRAWARSSGQKYWAATIPQAMKRPVLRGEEPAAREPGSGGWGLPGSRNLAARAMKDADTGRDDLAFVLRYQILTV